MLTIGARHASANTFVYATGLSTATLYTARHRNVLAAKHSSAKNCCVLLINHAGGARDARHAAPAHASTNSDACALGSYSKASSVRPAASSDYHPIHLGWRVAAGYRHGFHYLSLAAMLRQGYVSNAR
jgi:hypothetical protein